MRYKSRDGNAATAAEALGPDGFLKDGYAIVTSLALRDEVRLHDGAGGTPGHKPGFCMLDTNDAARQQAYDEYDVRMATAYLGDAREYPPSAEGQQCTVKGAAFRSHFGAPGHVRGGMCVPDEMRDASTRDSGLSLDALEMRHQKTMSRLYQQLDAELANAWRTP
jgi:hypothetical protein